MTFEEKISIVLRANKLGINTSEELSEKCGFDTSTIRKVIEREQKEIEAGSGKTPSLNLRSLRTLWDKIGINPEWWETGEGPVFIAGSPENHTGVQNGTDNKGNPLEDREGVYKTIVEGHTEYYLIPKTVFQEKYILVALDQFNKEKEKWEQDKQSFNKLLDMFEKELDKRESAPKAQSPENAK